MELFLLPKNSTSKVQPLYHGIIKSFKDKYKKYFMQESFLNDEDISFELFIKNFKLSDALPIVLRCWEEIETNAIKNCFMKAFKNFEGSENKESVTNLQTEVKKTSIVFEEESIESSDEFVFEEMENFSDDII